MDAHDFSLLALFLRASLTVQVVMIMLLAASVWAWAIIIQNTLRLRAARAQAAVFDAKFWSGEPLDKLYSGLTDKADTGPERIFVAGMDEWQRSYRQDGGLIPGVTSRIDRSMDVVIGREAESLSKGLSFLATVGATSPFVGLFGTVWGIKQSFQDIAISGSTNLVVVAPGLAEALLATALGLLAAIPAVIFYNKLAADSARIVSGYEAFADEFSTILSREVAD